ncbi:SDR family NAD(P)-dependent oxidoreductase [Pseudomonas putida]|uniref:SDR family NAD(P)-dependent oxidoreductase n=1 Tax=Pseudomonas putida TaxID=303 RepID=UPI0015FB4AF6|nr:SDR family NAD(P)-dependent oxidoreductase [Pseudomonas putida]
MKVDKSFNWNVANFGQLPAENMRIAVIGGTGGLGRALSHSLAKQGASVTVVGRTFRDQSLPGIRFVQGDLSLMSEAVRVVDELQVEQLDALVFTTGIFAASQRQETTEGLEEDMAVSYLSRLTILRLAAPRLGTERQSKAFKPRVFIMGYPGSGQTGTDLDDLNAERQYKSFAVHMNTVAGNEMLVVDAAKRYPHLSVFGLNPGLVKTNIRDNFLGKGSLKSKIAETLIGFFTPTAEQYAARISPLLLARALETHTGTLFNRKGQAIHPSAGLTPSHASKFLKGSEALVARTGVQLPTETSTAA